MGSEPERRALYPFHSVEYLREALVVWLARGEKINYPVQNCELLTAAGFRPDATSRADNREKYTPVQNQNYVVNALN
jgi:ABC-type amino acid transport substrate-binding protein